MDDEEVRYVLIGTEGGIVRYVRVLSDPIAEFQAIDEADKMFAGNKRKGVRVALWDYLLEKTIYYIPR